MFVGFSLGNAMRSRYLAIETVALAALAAVVIILGPGLALSGSEWEVLSAKGKTEWRAEAGKGE